MRYRHVLVTLGVATLLLFTACGPHRGHAGQDPAKTSKFVTWKVNDTLDDLKATAAQRAKVLAVKDRLLAAGLKLHAGHDATRSEVMRQWRSDRVNVQQLRTVADQRLTELRAFAYQGIDGLAEVHAALTPAQRAQVADEVDKLHGTP